MSKKQECPGCANQIGKMGCMGVPGDSDRAKCKVFAELKVARAALTEIAKLPEDGRIPPGPGWVADGYSIAAQIARAALDKGKG